MSPYGFHEGTLFLQIEKLSQGANWANKKNARNVECTCYINKAGKRMVVIEWGYMPLTILKKALLPEEAPKWQMEIY